MHLFIEASRHTTADRRGFVADPAFADVPVHGLLDPAYVSGRAALLDHARAAGHPAPGSPPGAAPDLPRPEGVEFDGDRTSHVSIVDAEGSAVAMTTTLNLSFGARVAVRGFLLNNAMVNFTSTRPYRGAPPVNAPAPGKRPRSAMAPVLGFDRSGALRLVAGAAGGSHIVDYVAQAILGVIVRGLDHQGAVEQPHFGGQKGHAVLEDGTPVAAHADALSAMGHRRLATEEMDSGAQLIVLPPEGGLRGGADPRRDGAVAGD